MSVSDKLLTDASSRTRKIERIVALFKENGFKGSQEEGERIASEILTMIGEIDTEPKAKT